MIAKSFSFYVNNCFGNINWTEEHDKILSEKLNLLEATGLSLLHITKISVMSGGIHHPYEDVITYLTLWKVAHGRQVRP